MSVLPIAVPVALIVALALAYRSYGWQGIAAVLSVVVFWMLLHVSRMMQVLKRAASRPLGFVASAVMLNAKLKQGDTLLHVVALTRSLGALQSPKNEQPEVFRWTDASDSYVTCTFIGGKLVRHVLVRPELQASDMTT